MELMLLAHITEALLWTYVYIDMEILLNQMISMDQKRTLPVERIQESYCQDQDRVNNITLNEPAKHHVWDNHLKITLAMIEIMELSHYSWRAFQMSFRDMSLTLMQTAHRITWCSLFYKLDDGSASEMWRLHLISKKSYCRFS